RPPEVEQPPAAGLAAHADGATPTAGTAAHADGAAPTAGTAARADGATPGAGTAGHAEPAAPAAGPAAPGEGGKLDAGSTPRVEAAAPVAVAPGRDEPGPPGAAPALAAAGPPETRIEVAGPAAGSTLVRAEGAPPAGPAAPGATGPSAEASEEPAPLPPPLLIKPRRHKTEVPPESLAPLMPWPAAADEAPPVREPTLILRDPARDSAPPPLVARTPTPEGQVVVAARTSSDELWSEPMSIPALPDRDPRLEAEGTTAPAGDEPDLLLDDVDTLDRHRDGRRDAGANGDASPGELTGVLDASAASPAPGAPGSDSTAATPEPRDFARELRAKMSMMAQRLFQGSDAPASPADHAPRHDHHTEIDLASLGVDQPLGVGAELEVPAAQRREPREAMTSPGSWDSQVRERGLPDAGTIMRGVSDAAMLLAKMFAQGATGRIAFRRDDVETIVFFDHGRPVFASSNEPRDRMGELLVREGKITASQYERCQSVVAESGRRMGEILVDFGYLKRRELLPAVRRHVEDIVYSLFGWERGGYTILHDAQPSAERIRLSRHPAALIIEGIRRKFDRTGLERLVGAPSTVIEVRDRERLGGIVHQGDLAMEERAALAALDGQADLAQVARTAGVDLADVLPLAWGLCVLGLATARRTDAEVPDESTALVGETDLAIDRERVRARWQLVSDADYFALLGVRRDATAFEIRRAYQSARRDFAADCFPSDLRRELARELDDIANVLDEAFRVLRDDRLRQTYLANLIDR
ncbi:MAG TPA: DUF4388 domain-containing protein, partial [Kofleriaceae bacterium]|nr:DUF4388 domain-containing protein [Kofleriaceae bacterium]